MFQQKDEAWIGSPVGTVQIEDFYKADPIARKRGVPVITFSAIAMVLYLT